MRYLLIFFAFLPAFFGLTVEPLCAQTLGEWNVYPSYQTATQNIVVGRSVYSLMDGNLLRYDTEDGNVKLYDCLGELSDVHINFIGYSEEAKRLILVYDNENIDLMDLDDNVLNLSSLKDKALADKDVSGVSVHGTMAYLATGFGFLTLDMAEGVVRDTYRLGIDVHSVAVCDDLLWICGMNGVYCIPVASEEKHSLSAWKCRHTAANWLQMAVQGNELFIRHKSGIYRFLEKTTPLLKSGTYTYIKALPDGNVYFGNAQEVNVCSASATVTTYAFQNTWNDLSAGKSGVFWASAGEEGLKPYKLSDGTWVEGNEKIQPNSPRHDLTYRMSYVTNAQGDYRLLVAGGTNSYNDDISLPLAMYYDNDGWVNFDESPLAEMLPGVKQRNTTDVVQDPNDPDHHFVGTWRNGLKEFRKGKLVHIYTCDNSPLESIIPNDPNYLMYMPATAVKYDAEGNLWMANQNTATPIRFIDPAGKWYSLSYPELNEDIRFVSGFLFSSSGVNFMASQTWPTAGIFGFHTNGTLTNVRDDKHRLITNVVNQDDTSYDPGIVYALTEDLDGRIWCGTQKGLFVIDDPTTFFDSDFRFTQVKIARNDGSGLADYLLNGVCIQCIAVDGGNRKWIGTESNGLYLISADGTEMIQHFQASDSPLLSDNVYSVAIHPKDGTVMIGTDKGLCSYVSDATEAEETLEADRVIAYPNPVSPDFTGPIRIEGLTLNAEVKICSATGQLVWSGVSNGGTCTWNGCNKQGRRVASGVYNVISNTEDGGKAVVTRIIVIR